MERQVLIMDYEKIGKFIAEKRKESVFLYSGNFVCFHPIYTDCHAPTKVAQLDILLRPGCLCHQYNSCAGHAADDRQCKSFFSILSVNA